MAPQQRPRTAPPARRPRVAGRPSPTRRTPDPAAEAAAPETEAAETAAPGTEAAATEAPETGAAETEAPETEAPETEAPETEVAETAAPEAADVKPADVETGATKAESAEVDTDSAASASADAAGIETVETGTADEATETAETPDGATETAAIPATQPKRPRPGAPTGRRRGQDTVVEYAPQSEVSRPAAQTRADRDRRTNPLVLPLVLIAIAVLLAAFAVFAGIKAAGYGSGDTTNRAITDDTTTRTVQQQATTALNTLLSFDFHNPTKSQTDAANLTTGKIGGSYEQLMGFLRDQGARNQLSLSSSVLISGVQRLQGNNARVLALLSQTYSKGTGAPARQTLLPVMVRVDLTQTGGAWKVNNLTLLNN